MYFFHDKSSSVSQFISGKPRNLEKLLRYLSDLVTLTFRVGTSGRFAAPSFPGGAGVFLTIFVEYINDLPSDALSLILSIWSVQ